MSDHRCPACHAELNACTGVGRSTGALPNADDVSVCRYCGEFLQFNADLTHRRADPGVWSELSPQQQQDIRRLQHGIRQRRAALLDDGPYEPDRPPECEDCGGRGCAVCDAPGYRGPRIDHEDP